jgi:hypothetical protein
MQYSLFGENRKCRKCGKIKEIKPDRLKKQDYVCVDCRRQERKESRQRNLQRAKERYWKRVGYCKVKYEGKEYYKTCSKCRILKEKINFYNTSGVCRTCLGVGKGSAKQKRPYYQKGRNGICYREIDITKIRFLTCVKCKKMKSVENFSDVTYTWHKKSKVCDKCRDVKSTNDVRYVGNEISELKCIDCGKFKPTKVYDKIKSKLGFTRVCKKCRRGRRYKSVYGITMEEYEKMYKKQKGKCQLCGKKEKKLKVDHCHSNGQVRGLLCTTCNTGLGHLKDNTSILENAIQYLNGKL